MTTPLVSIIVTCYNQEYYIRQALESILSQTYTNWECIVIDDGSTDDSANVIRKFIKADKRFLYFHQPNAGVSNARNTGFALAKGEYINFLDGDDTFLPEKLALQMRVFEDNPEVDICICNHQHYDARKNVFAYYSFEILEEKPLKQILYKWQNGVAFPLHAAMYRSYIWKEGESPYPKEYHGRSEDWIFNILVALKNKKYYYLSKVLCTYHHDGSNYTNDVFNSASSAIHAAFFIHPFLPKEFQTDFIDHTIRKSMNRYVNGQKVAILHDSGNWRLGNFLTEPFFWLKKKIRG